MKKILVIDDDKMVLLTLKRLLAKEGYRVFPAQNGTEALDLLSSANFEFDLIISDLKMPNMNGIEVIKEIRRLISDKKKKPIPEIIITGFAKEEIYLDALKLKAAAYIDKPFDMMPLLETIRKIIGASDNLL